MKFIFYCTEYRPHFSAGRLGKVAVWVRVEWELQEKERKRNSDFSGFWRAVVGETALPMEMIFVIVRVLGFSAVFCSKTMAHKSVSIVVLHVAENLVAVFIQEPMTLLFDRVTLHMKALGFRKNCIRCFQPNSWKERVFGKKIDLSEIHKNWYNFQFLIWGGFIFYFIPFSSLPMEDDFY